MTKPTVGRIVHFWPAGTSEDSAPCAAIIVSVIDDRTINITAYNKVGEHIPRPPTNVKLLQDNDPAPGTDVDYCKWPTIA